MKKTPYNTLRPRTRPYVIKPKALVDQAKPTRIIKRVASPISKQLQHRRGGI